MIKVFLLDDDELANELIIYILELAGITDYEIRTSGEDALAYLDNCKSQNNFPDIMFVDINMPGMNGFDFVEQYEEKYRLYSPNTRIIMLTNSVLASEKKYAENYDSISDFLNKPLTLNRLNELLKSVKADSW